MACESSIRPSRMPHPPIGSILAIVTVPGHRSRHGATSLRNVLIGSIRHNTRAKIAAWSARFRFGFHRLQQPVRGRVWVERIPPKKAVAISEYFEYEMDRPTTKVQDLDRALTRGRGPADGGESRMPHSRSTVGPAIQFHRRLAHADRIDSCCQPVDVASPDTLSRRGLRDSLWTCAFVNSAVEGPRCHPPRPRFRIR